MWIAAVVDVQYQLENTFANGWPSGRAGFLVWWLMRLRGSRRFGSRQSEKPKTRSRFMLAA